MTAIIPIFLILSLILGFLFSLIYFEFTHKPINNFLLLIVSLFYSIIGGIIAANTIGNSNSEGIIFVLVFSIIQIIPFYLGAVYLNKRKSQKDK